MNIINDNTGLSADEGLNMAASAEVRPTMNKAQACVAYIQARPTIGRCKVYWSEALGHPVAEQYADPNHTLTGAADRFDRGRGRIKGGFDFSGMADKPRFVMA